MRMIVPFVVASIGRSTSRITSSGTEGSFVNNDKMRRGSAERPASSTAWKRHNLAAIREMDMASSSSSQLIRRSVRSDPDTLRIPSNIIIDCLCVAATMYVEVFS